MSGYDEHQAMWPQMISALAAIDAELGIPDDGCNSTAQTLEKIRRLRVAMEWYRDEARALAVNVATGVHTAAVLASVTVLSLDAGKRADAALGIAEGGR
jgi:hypothetical protein